MNLHFPLDTYLLYLFSIPIPLYNITYINLLYAQIKQTVNLKATFKNFINFGSGTSEL